MAHDFQCVCLYPGQGLTSSDRLMSRFTGFKDRCLHQVHVLRICISAQVILAFFCNLADITPVHLSQDFACRYIAFLSERLSYNSIKQYINVVRILHLEAGHVNHFLSCWHIDTLLKGTKRVLGVSISKCYLSLWISFVECLLLSFCLAL